jgi:Flp pilus assembly pilin Flp
MGMHRGMAMSGQKDSWLQKVKSFVMSEDGASFAEYCILITLIAIVCAIGVGTFGGGVLRLFEDPRLETFLTGN